METLTEKVKEILKDTPWARKWLCQNISFDIKNVLWSLWQTSLLNEWQHWTVLLENNWEKVQIDGAPLDWSATITIKDVTASYKDFWDMPLIDGKAHIKINS